MYFLGVPGICNKLNTPQVAFQIIDLFNFKEEE